jgi:hypothetical protein
MRIAFAIKALRACGLVAAMLFTCPQAQAQLTDVTGEGTGVFLPATGLFYGTGNGNLLDERFFSGVVDVEPLDLNNLTKPLKFKNKGRGTSNETFQEIITRDGSSLSLRFNGTVQLQPVAGEETFTATWLGDFDIVTGTGRFKGATGSFDVVATNQPFLLTDPAWKFDWTWTGRMRRTRNALQAYSILTTEGFGTFDPANLGVGTPAQFPLVIGDGSGLAIYDGTPTGSNHRLDGILVNSGNDQHFGTAQSVSLGVLAGLPTSPLIQYPGTDGNAGQDIHRMVTDIGELWLQKDYYFELDPTQGTLVAPVDFRVIGGTGLYRGAKGSIFCFVTIDFPAVNPFAETVVAPFHYDFDGYVELTLVNRLTLHILQWFWQWQG